MGHKGPFQAFTSICTACGRDTFATDNCVDELKKPMSLHEQLLKVGEILTKAATLHHDRISWGVVVDHIVQARTHLSTAIRNLESPLPDSWRDVAADMLRLGGNDAEVLNLMMREAEDMVMAIRPLPYLNALEVLCDKVRAYIEDVSRYIPPEDRHSYGVIYAAVQEVIRIKGR